MIRESIAQLVEGHDLSQAQAAQVMLEMMEGQATAAQQAAFLIALRHKGESVDEIAGMARVMREKALRVTVGAPEALLDTCGTGGDGAQTFNISTVGALIAAGAGLRVAKHGGRGISSRCGSGDLLEAMGVKIDLGPEGVARCIDEAGIGFMYAVVFHPAMRATNEPRKEVGVRTVFNILGPLTNPANAGHQVVGVPRPHLVETIAMVLGELGARHAIVVHGSAGGLDELSLSGPSLISEYISGRGLTVREIAPEDVGLHRAPLEAVKSGDVQRSRDIVLLNAGAALVAGEASNDLKEGISLARKVLDSGAVADRLERLAQASQAAGKAT